MVAQIRLYGFGDEMWFKVYINDVESIIKILRSIIAHIIKQGSSYQPQIDVIASLILLKCIQAATEECDRESIADIDPKFSYDNKSDMTYEIDIERVKLSYTFTNVILEDVPDITKEVIESIISFSKKISEIGGYKHA